jgi:alkanesulfonate monooxygenase SsuD/methylene tetrahydromethanopterin reductase-like flavin-dependent oxidoreductase (luciferase family)
MEIVKSSAKRSGRDPEQIEPIAEIVTSLADDAQGLRAATDKMKHILILEGLLLKERGFELPPELDKTYQNLLMTDEQVRVLGESARIVPDELALEVMAHGSPNEIAETIERFKAAGVRHLLIQFLEPGERSLRKFCEEVLPQVDRQNLP